MASGKFSKPRPYRDEERQIEQAFRQVTGQEPAPRSPLSREDAQIEQTFRQLTNQQPPYAAPKQTTVPTAEKFDLLPEDMDAFFDGDLPDYSQEPEDSQPDFIDKLLVFWNQTVDFCSKNQKIVMVGLCAVALLLIASFIGVFFASTTDPYGEKILDNVIIADINVGGMTKNEAISAVKQATSHTYPVQDMVIDLSGVELRLSPKDTGAQLDVKSAVNEAYDYGRTGTQSEREQALEASRLEEHVIGLLPYLNLDEDYIREVLTQYSDDVGSTLTQPTYGLEGAEPELSTDKFDENAPCQTLVITLGTPGIGFDVNDVYDQVLDAYSLHVFLVTVEDIESVKDPDPVDLEAIYAEFYIEPVDASIDMQTFKPIPGSYGYGFDLMEAQKLIDAAQFGDEVRIPMEYIAPEVLEAGSFFQDILGEHQTRHTSNESRNTNLRLACQAIDGLVLDPGEVFSFNQVVGERTTAKGYKSAPSDSSPTAESTLGGGISQVSSTLYYATLLSDLDIVSRTANKIVPNYIDYGMDAAVSWNHYDFQFRNNQSYPIQIRAEVSGGYVKIRILGTEERDYYIMMDYTVSQTYQPETEYKEFAFDNEEGYRDGDVIQEGVSGYLIKTYKVKYSKDTNTRLSKDFVANTEYPVTNQIVARVEKPVETTVPTEETQPPETQAPTQPAPPETSEPTESTQATEAPNISNTTAPPQASEDSSGLSDPEEPLSPAA